MRYLIALLVAFLPGLCGAGITEMHSALLAREKVSGAPPAYNAHLLFLWENPSSTTVEHSDGDDTATANGTVEITGGAVVATDSGADGGDYYAFDVSSNDIVDAGGVGTAFIRFSTASWGTGYESIWSVYCDFDDYFIIDPQDATDRYIRIIYSDDNAGPLSLTHASILTTDTVYWLRIQWQNSSPYLSLSIFADSAGSMGSEVGSTVTETTNGWDVVSSAAAGDFHVGNNGGAGSVPSIYRIAVYDDVRATEP